MSSPKCMLYAEFEFQTLNNMLGLIRKYYVYLFIFIVLISGISGMQGEWCLGYDTATFFCETNCCGTFWNRTCCPSTPPTTRSPFSYNTHSHDKSDEKGEWCAYNGGSRYCRTGCCGNNYLNRICCPITERPTTRYPTWRPTTRYPTWRPTWRPTTRYPTWRPFTTDRSHGGVWCNHKGGSMYCRYGCCGTYYNRTCCTATDKPQRVTAQPNVSTGTIVSVVVNCLAAVIIAVAIFIGVFCCLKTKRGVRGQMQPAMVTGSTNIHPGSQNTGPPVYAVPTQTHAGPPSHPSFTNPVYFSPSCEAPIQSQGYTHGQQSQQV